jgi:drug/metabolite transporter superfamily protein YnfA
MFELKTTGLFIATAIAEIVGCYLPYLWLGVAVTLVGMAIIMFAPRHA